MSAAALVAQQVPMPAAPAAASSARVMPLLDSARHALSTGQVEPAIRLAEQYTSRNYRDPKGYVVLGDAYFRRMPAGRFQALRAYEEAVRLAPDDPEPAYLYAQVGIYLGGDDGEAIARRGLEHVIELDPFYRTAWTQWMLVFRNNGSRRRMRDRLEQFDSIPEIRARMAYLDIEDELYPIADSALDLLLAVDSTNVEWLAWRAQSAFESGDTETGAAYYARALANAEHDSTDVLWRQAVGVAHPDEARAWSRLRPQGRAAWLQSFWARRNPDLFAGGNKRLGEHFQRLRYARRNFPLLHPLVSYHRSQIARAMNLEPARGERDFYQRCEMYEVQMPKAERHIPIQSGDTEEARRAGFGAFERERAMAAGAPPAGVSSATDRARLSPGDFNTLTDEESGNVRGAAGFFERTIFVPLNMDLRSVDTTAARVGYNLATGLEDRGILYLRFGPPGRMQIGGNNSADPNCVTPDVELWRYDDIGIVRFARPSAFSRGERTVSEMVFRSMNARQFEAMQTALTRDRSSEPAPLQFGVWTAQFAGGRPGSTEIAVIATRGTLAATLAEPGEVRRGPNGFVILDADPGRHTLLAHVRDSAKLGRQDIAVEARAFTGAPALSDLLLAPAWSGPLPTRFWDVLRHVQRTLVFPEGQVMRVFAEVYGLASAGQTVRYRAEYALLRTDNPNRDYGRDDWPGALQLQFEREAPAATDAPGAIREMLDITPERLPPGKYLLRLRVVDRIAEREAGRSQIAFEVR